LSEKFKNWNDVLNYLIPNEQQWKKNTLRNMIKQGRIKNEVCCWVESGVLWWRSSI
jgi:hypothetical protein